MEEEDARISALRNTKNSHPKDYQLRVTLDSHKQRERFKKKWLSLDERVRSKAVYTVVMRAKNSN
jgi:spore coat polysaccharide biosynthesis protein SpsF (cytidylyltransferase family)